MRSFNRKGMTLVEVLVSGIVGAIVAGMVLTIISMQGSTLNEGTANAKTLRQANLIDEIIASKIRRSNLVLAPDDSGGWSNPHPILARRSVSTVLAYDSAGNVRGGIRKQGTDFQESSDGAAWSNVSVAGEPVTVISTDPFVLSADRKQLGLNMTIRTTYRGKNYTSVLNGSMYRCRN